MSKAKQPDTGSINRAFSTAARDETANELAALVMESIDDGTFDDQAVRNQIAFLAGQYKHRAEMAAALAERRPA